MIEFFIVFSIYMMPTIIAFARHRKDAMSILLLNLLFGWTGIGWVLSLIWTLKK